MYEFPLIDMSSEIGNIVCASCGLKSSNIKNKQGYNLCSFCTLDHNIDPDFETIVYATAVGYFISEKFVDNQKDALERATEFVSQLPYWQDKELPIPSLNGLKRVQSAISLSTNMKKLDYDEDFLES